jgi:hypothetical protein
MKTHPAFYVNEHILEQAVGELTLYECPFAPKHETFSRVLGYISSAMRQVNSPRNCDVHQGKWDQ